MAVKKNMIFHSNPSYGGRLIIVEQGRERGGEKTKTKILSFFLPFCIAIEMWWQQQQQER